MNIEKLYQILRETTGQFRKGAVYQVTPELVAQMEAGIDPDVGLQGGGMIEIYDMPPESGIPAECETVDLHFVTIPVNKAKAEARKADLLEILNDWPNPEELAGGPSYISVGGTIGDQGAAFELFALGKVLGIWDVITPATFGMIGDQADQAAGSGYIMCTGYRSKVAA